MVVVPDVVVVVVAGAAVVVVQQGLVGKVGVRSMPMPMPMPNLASWLLLQSRQVPGRAGGGTYSMPTVSRMAPITARGSDRPFTIGWRRQTSRTTNLMPPANSDPDCCRSRGWGNQYKQCGANRMAAKVHLKKMALLIRGILFPTLLLCSAEMFLPCPSNGPLTWCDTCCFLFLGIWVTMMEQFEIS